MGANLRKAGVARALLALQCGRAGEFGDQCVDHGVE
jgi:hypothetical protein